MEEEFVVPDPLMKDQLLNYLYINKPMIEKFKDYFNFPEHQGSDIKTNDIEFIFRFDTIYNMICDMINFLNNEENK